MAERQLTLRLPDDLHTSLTALANDDLRSLNAEILVLLREAIVARMRAKAQPAETAKFFQIAPMNVNGIVYNGVHLSSTGTPVLTRLIVGEGGDWSFDSTEPFDFRVAPQGWENTIIRPLD